MADKNIQPGTDVARLRALVDALDYLMGRNHEQVGFGLAKDIYDRYCRYSRDHQIKPFSYMYFYTNLGYLQSVGLVALVAAKIDRTYTNRIVLTVDKSIAEQSCKLRFE